MTQTERFVSGAFPFYAACASMLIGFVIFCVIFLSQVDEKKEKKLQQTIINIKDKYGKNSVLKGMNLEDGATTIERNEQIGGHKANGTSTSTHAAI